MKTEYMQASPSANFDYPADDGAGQNQYVLERVLQLSREWVERIPASDPQRLMAIRLSIQPAPIGIMPACSVTKQCHTLAHGEEAVLLVYSDGLTGMRTPGGDMLSQTGILAAASGNANTVGDRLIEKITLHGHTAQDDISIVMVRVPLNGASEIEQAADITAPHVAATDAALHIVENFPGGLMLTDADQRILYVNPAFCKVTGYLPAGICGRELSLFNSGRHGDIFLCQLWQDLLERYEWSGEIWNRRKDGSVYAEWVDIVTLRDAAGAATHFLAAFSDIGQHRQREDRLQYQALHDPLANWKLDDCPCHDLNRQQLADAQLAVSMKTCTHLWTYEKDIQTVFNSPKTELL